MTSSSSSLSPSLSSDNSSPYQFDHVIPLKISSLNKIAIHMCYFVLKNNYVLNNHDDMVNEVSPAASYLFGLLHNIRGIELSNRKDLLLRIFIDRSVERYWSIQGVWNKLLAYLKTKSFINLIRVSIPSIQYSNDAGKTLIPHIIHHTQYFNTYYVRVISFFLSILCILKGDTCGHVGFSATNFRFFIPCDDESSMILFRDVDTIYDWKINGDHDIGQFIASDAVICRWKSNNYPFPLIACSFGIKGTLLNYLRSNQKLNKYIYSFFYFFDLSLTKQQFLLRNIKDSNTQQFRKTQQSYYPYHTDELFLKLLFNHLQYKKQIKLNSQTHSVLDYPSFSVVCEPRNDSNCIYPNCDLLPLNNSITYILKLLK